MSPKQTLLQLYLEPCPGLCLGEPPAAAAPACTHAPPPLLLLHRDQVFWEAGEGNQLRDFLELNPCSLPWRRITVNPVEVPGSARFWTREGGRGGSRHQEV